MKIKNNIKHWFEKIRDGFLEHIGATIAITIATTFSTFLGSYIGGQQSSKAMVEEIAKRDSIFIVNNVSNYSLAKEYELAGFQALVNKDIDEAISCFIASENSANQYHASYEIANYLKKNKKNVSQPDFWQRTYKYIIANYRGYIPSEIIQAMKE